MKELDDETTQLLTTMGSSWKSFGCGYPDVFWLGGTVKEAKAWRERTKAKVSMAVIPADSKTLRDWRLDPSASNTIVAIRGVRVRGVVRDATSATLGGRLKNAIAEVNTPAAILQRLASKDLNTRRDSIHDAQMLGAQGAPVVPRLVELLEDPDRGVQLGAARALGVIGPHTKTVLPALAERLGHKSESTRTAVLSALGAMRSEGDRVIPLISLHLRKDPSSTVRVSAASALGGATRCRAAQALPALFEGLKDDQEAVRFAAAAAIQRLYGPTRRRGD